MLFSMYPGSLAAAAHAVHGQSRSHICRKGLHFQLFKVWQWN